MTLHRNNDIARLRQVFSARALYTISRKNKQRYFIIAGR